MHFGEIDGYQKLGLLASTDEDYPGYMICVEYPIPSFSGRFGEIGTEIYWQ